MTPISKVDFGQLEKPALAGQVALVTGGSRGIGRAIAQRLASMGSSVAICGRDSDALQAVEAELRAQVTSVVAQRADVRSASDVEALVRSVESTLGPISILVNNAGIGEFGAAHEKSEADWDRVLDTNLKSAFLVSKAVVPSMMRMGRGDIINIASLAGKNAFGGGGLYCASKWGLRGLTACMAEDLRGHNIRVAAIFPGSVATEFSGRGPKDATKVLTADDVAHAVAMLVTQGPQSFLSEVDLRPLRKS
jgi:NAD(P)-dependent dehydrogenase (short-subunit alcohol dehydrogenase family)